MLVSRKTDQGDSHRLQSLWEQSRCGQWGSCSEAGGPESHELSWWDVIEKWQECPGPRGTPNISLAAGLGNPVREDKKMAELVKLHRLFFACWSEIKEWTWITVRGLSEGYQRGKPKRVTHAERIRYVSEHLVLTTLAPTHRQTMQ